MSPGCCRTCKDLIPYLMSGWGPSCHPRRGRHSEHRMDWWTAQRHSPYAWICLQDVRGVRFRGNEAGCWMTRTYPRGDHRSETCAPRPFWSTGRYSDCPQRCASWPPADPASWSGWTVWTASWWQLATSQILPRTRARAQPRRTCVQRTRTQSWRKPCCCPRFWCWLFPFFFCLWLRRGFCWRLIAFAVGLFSPQTPPADFSLLTNPNLWAVADCTVPLENLQNKRKTHWTINKNHIRFCLPLGLKVSMGVFLFHLFICVYEFCAVVLIFGNF